MLVYLDAGHGLKDSGAVGNGIYEKHITLNVTLKTGEILKNKGINVAYTRTDDSFLSLKQRTDKANGLKANLFVSIHCNSAVNSSAQGVETFYYPTSSKGKALANDIQNSILDHKVYTKDRGIKSANFHVIRASSMPSALVELAFISNTEDSNILKNKQNELANAIAIGILKNLNIGITAPIVPNESNVSGELYKVQVGAYSDPKNADAVAQELKDKGFNPYITKS